MYSCNFYNTIDLKTPYNTQLTPFYSRSPAFYTMKTRIPTILQDTSEMLIKNKDRIYADSGTGCKGALKEAITAVLGLKEEVENNGILRFIESKASDAECFNQRMREVQRDEGRLTFYTAPLLLSECYVYRRIQEAFEMSMGDYDQFGVQKEEQFYASLPNITALAKYVTSDCSCNTKDEFIKLLKLNLWGNRLDLSLTCGKPTSHEFDPLTSYKQLEPFILSDQSGEVWEAVSNPKAASQILAIVCDNVGYELFSQCCQADLVISRDLVSVVRFYVKCIPWCISDVTTRDFHWMLNLLKCSGDACLQAIGSKWSDYVDKGVWDIIEDPFWTLPCAFTNMKRTNLNLYKELSHAKLILFTGDMNYRKLMGDLNWIPTTPFTEALQGFNPSKLAIMRTIKVDSISGLKDGIVDGISAKDPGWMSSGMYGLIQYSGTVDNK